MRALAVALISCWTIHAEWIRVETPGIEIYTDAGEKTGRAVLERFDRIRAIFHQAGIGEGPLRLRAFVFSSQAEFHRYSPHADGFFQSGADRDYIALHAGADDARVAFHEYVHRVLRHSGVVLPKWFDEGLSEFYSNATLEGAKLKVGAPIAAHVELLRTSRLRVGSDLAGSGEDPLFYAESWALVHMLNLSPRWRDGLPRFVLGLTEGKAAEDSFREGFGRTLDDAIRDVPGYVKEMRAVTVQTAVERPGPATVTRIDAEEAAIARAGLAIAIRDPELADVLLAKLPETAASEAMRGSVALARNRRDEAGRHLDRAIQLGSREASLYFEYAMLEHESGRPDRTWLLKAIEADPEFGEALFLIGVRETDDGDLVKAIAHLQSAVRVQPDRSTWWHALGYAQSRAGDFAAARESAGRAMATAETDLERSMASALADVAPSSPVPARRGVVTPPSWQMPKGDARIEGTIVHFDCESSPPAIEVRGPGAESMTLLLADPSRIELVNAPSASLELPCGAMRVRAVIDYDSGSRTVRRIEFRL